MSRIKSTNTKPEIFVRKLLHSLGYRFRLNGQISKTIYPKETLPGKPDIVLAGHKAVIFVHGCFWHRHKGCKDATMPKTRTDWWLDKLNKNVERDNKKTQELEKAGWKVVVVWECEATSKNAKSLTKRLKEEIDN